MMINKKKNSIRIQQIISAAVSITTQNVCRGTGKHEKSSVLENVCTYILTVSFCRIIIINNLVN